MSIDRRIDLKLSVPDFRQPSADGGVGGDGAPQREAPERETEERFAAALAARGKASPEAAAAPVPFWPSPTLPASSRCDEAAPPRNSEFAANLGGEVERLMVGDGSSGNRQVRIELKHDLLPGVSVVIEERDGRLQVDFVCSNDASRRKLNQTLPELATTLAGRLRREVLLRTQTDDDEDLCLNEALGCP